MSVAWKANNKGTFDHLKLFFPSSIILLDGQFCCPWDSFLPGVFLMKMGHMCVTSGIPLWPLSRPWHGALISVWPFHCYLAAINWKAWGSEPHFFFFESCPLFGERGKPFVLLGAHLPHLNWNWDDHMIFSHVRTRLGCVHLKRSDFFIPSFQILGVMTFPPKQNQTKPKPPANPPR